MMQNNSHWRLSRRIPVTVILALLLQIGGALMWATQIDARVGTLEDQSISSVEMNEKFARLEERLDNMKDDLTGMRRQLDHLTDHFLKP